MADTTPVADTPLTERVILLIAKDGSRARGSTPNPAMERLRRITQSPVLMSYRCHPQTKIVSTGYLTYPEGAPPELVMLRKQGEEWIAITSK